MTVPVGQWRIEVRSFRVGDGGLNYAHSYLAVVDPSGVVTMEIHGHPHNGGPTNSWSGVEQNWWTLAFDDSPLRVFKFPSETFVGEEGVLGPWGRVHATIWTGSAAEKDMILNGIGMIEEEIANAQLRYELPGVSAGDARNSNAVFRTMVDFIRDYTTEHGIGEFGLPKSVIEDYWRELQQLDFDQRAERADWIRESEATGIPLELLDDTIQNDDGYAALAPGIHRNLIKIDPATGSPPDAIEDMSVYPPALDRFMNPAPAFAPSRSRQSPRVAPGRPDQKVQLPEMTHISGSSYGGSAEGGNGDLTEKKRQSADRAIPDYSVASSNGSPGSFHAMLASRDKRDVSNLLTVPGAAMSAAQRDTLMRLPAFSDEGDPLFGAAVWKYSDANAAGAARALEVGAVDAFGRAARPVFADADGAPADADGTPMAEALGRVAQRLDKAAGAVGPVPAVKALQGAVNDLGDAQVEADTPRDGLKARRRVPRLAVDGDLGPHTRQAVRLALHQAGPGRLAAGLDPEG